MTELIFGTCNHLFTKRRTKMPCHNLVKICPEEDKAEIAFVGWVNKKTHNTTIMNVSSIVKEMSEVCQENGKCNQDTLSPQISTDESIGQNTLFCCIPKL